MNPTTTFLFPMEILSSFNNYLFRSACSRQWWCQSRGGAKPPNGGGDRKSTRRTYTCRGSCWAVSTWKSSIGNSLWHLIPPATIRYTYESVWIIANSWLTRTLSVEHIPRAHVALLTKVKDPLPKEKLASVVYQIPCQCGKVYVGETQRRLETRVKEHRDACTKGDTWKSAIAEHQWDLQHQVD
jgi:hypothetical protein